MPDSAAALVETVDVDALLSVLAQVRRGDLTARMPRDRTGTAGKVADGLNDVIIANQALDAELARVREATGRKARLSQRVMLGGLTDSWRSSIDSVNELLDDLVRPTSEMQRVIGAVADDACKKVWADVRGEMLELETTIHGLAGQLNGFAAELTAFLAYMSHELRTPLDSLLMLAGQLEDDPDGTMTATQVEYASVISASATDLLTLLNGLLDLAKVDSGTATIETIDIPVAQLCGDLLREFRHVAEGKGVRYRIERGLRCPAEIVTDLQRLRQILRNLLANAFKFTADGEVALRVDLATSGWDPENQSLAPAARVVSFAVSDTGIGVAEEHQRRIFDEFAQIDGSIAHLHGGTGLGLSISRELAGIMGGEITLESAPGRGSTFTLYLPAGPPKSVTAPPVLSRGMIGDVVGSERPRRLEAATS